jgi:hypothetical protein
VIRNPKSCVTPILSAELDVELKVVNKVAREVVSNNFFKFINLFLLFNYDVSYKGSGRREAMIDLYINFIPNFKA